MRLRCAGLLLLLCWGAVAMAAASGPVACQAPCQALRVGMEDYPPYSYLDADGQPDGLSVRLLRAVAQQAGLVLVFEPSRLFWQVEQRARQHQIDLIMSLRPTPQRAATLGFTRPYLLSPVQVISRADQPYPSLGALSGQPVGVGRGFGVEAFARQHFPAVRWVAFDKDSQALQALAQGQLAAMVGDVTSVRWLMADHPAAYHIGDEIGFTYAYSYGWRKDRPDIGLRLDQALIALSAAERRQLLAPWLGQGRPLSAHLGLDWSWLAGLLMVLGAGLLLWHYARQRYRKDDDARTP